MTVEKVSLSDKLAAISDYWDPHIVADYNGNEVRLVKLKGEFTWHSHTETDEVFLVVKGHMTLEFRDRVLELRLGELAVVPRGTEHCPVAVEECHILVLDREGEPNTGANPSLYTRAKLTSI